MAIFALADLHLSLGVPSKDMAVFGPEWEDYMAHIKQEWERVVKPDDLVVIAGDISWAMRSEEALIDLNWIDKLPGTKALIKGNHDYWWGSLSKVQALMPPSLHPIQHTAFSWKGASISGTRLWDTDEFSFVDAIALKDNPNQAASEKDLKHDEKTFARELHRLELACQTLDQTASLRIIMTHYPPIGSDLKPSKASKILEQYRVDICVFGHLHSIKSEVKMFGEANGVRYLLTSADYCDFKPVKLCD